MIDGCPASLAGQKDTLCWYGDEHWELLGGILTAAGLELSLEVQPMGTSTPQAATSPLHTAQDCLAVPTQRLHIHQWPIHCQTATGALDTGRWTSIQSTLTQATPTSTSTSASSILHLLSTPDHPLSPSHLLTASSSASPISRFADSSAFPFLDTSSERADNKENRRR